jgi:hypothetical protein
MMVQALMFLPRLVVTPPARLVVVQPQSAAVRRFTAPGVQLGEDGGRPARGAEQLLAARSNAQARGGSVQMCSATRDSDRDKLLAAVQQMYGRAVWSAAVHRDGLALEHASTELKENRGVVLAAVHQNGLALRHSSAELKGDREVVLAAVQRHGCALCYASAELKADREVVLAAVQHHGRALEYASPELQADREVVLALVQQDGNTLCYASAELRADREVVLAAEHQNGNALRFASAELQADREVVLAAVHQNRYALRHASAELLRDDAVLRASNHIFADLDRLADRGQLKVLRTLASVRECGHQMNNCLAGYDFAQCGRHILVKLDGDDGIDPLAVGSFENGEWKQIRYANSRGPRGGGNRACARGSSTTLPPANKEDILGQFDAFLPALQAFQRENQ